MSPYQREQNYANNSRVTKAWSSKEYTQIPSTTEMDFSGPLTQTLTVPDFTQVPDIDLAFNERSLEPIAPTNGSVWDFTPPPTVFGLLLTEFSYLFLIVVVTAPIAFILIVAIVMKCYTWQRYTRLSPMKEKHFDKDLAGVAYSYREYPTVNGANSVGNLQASFSR